MIKKKKPTAEEMRKFKERNDQEEIRIQAAKNQRAIEKKKKESKPKLPKEAGGLTMEVTEKNYALMGLTKKEYEEQYKDKKKKPTMMSKNSKDAKKDKK